MSILNHFFDYKPEVLALDEKAMELCQPYFRQMEEIRDFNQLKMLKAFADTQMSSTDMLGTTGYGLWDTGRAKLEQIFAQVMGAEDALVRSQFQSGTHTLAVALFGLLRAGDTLLAATGRPYDTLEGVIGLDGKGKGTGTLMDYGVNYDEAPLKADFTPDYDLIAQKAPGAKVCHIQRSRGYLQRNAFDLATIRKIADTARAANPEIIIFVDNCYGEFTQTQEPCQVGADIAVGSLIKNPGGGAFLQQPGAQVDHVRKGQHGICPIRIQPGKSGAGQHHCGVDPHGVRFHGNAPSAGGKIRFRGTAIQPGHHL